MFFLKALATSLLTVIRAGKWQRRWSVTAWRFGIATIPGAMVAVVIRVSVPGGGEDPSWGNAATTYLWLALPVLIYGILGGAAVDHYVARVGGLLTWLSHLLWSLMVGTVVVGGWFLWSASSGNVTDAATAWLALSWLPLAATIVHLFAGFVPGSFPKPKAVRENIKDVRDLYRKLRAKGANWRDDRDGRRDRRLEAKSERLEKRRELKQRPAALPPGRSRPERLNREPDQH